MPHWLWYVIGAALVGLAYALTNKTARKIISAVHETRTQVDATTWEVRGRTDTLQNAVSDVCGRADTLHHAVSEVRAELTRVADGLGAMEERLARLPLSNVPVRGASTAQPPAASTTAVAASPRMLDLIPCDWRVAGDTVVLYGVGDGADLADLCAANPRAQIMALDRNPRALTLAAERLPVTSRVDPRLVLPDGRLPLDDASVDAIECPRLDLHPDAAAPLLAEFRRVLKPSGRIRVGVLAPDSVWMHLYLGYVRGVLGRHDGPDTDESFVRSVLTDADEATVARALALAQPQHLTALARGAGFTSARIGARAAWFELTLLPRRQEALLCDRLPARHADFLRGVEIDSDGQPLHGEKPCGVIALHELRVA